MRQTFKARTEILPGAQQELWPQLEPIQSESFVLYGGTAVALHLGHRTSVDFDFFRTASLDKQQLTNTLAFMRGAQIIQDAPDTLVASVAMPSGPVKLSFFGGMGFGHINEPLQTSDLVLRVASQNDLLATKLKAILDRAEAKDYRDIAALLEAGTSLEQGLGAFASMFKNDPALPLRALGFFKDGDLPNLSQQDQRLLRNARDDVGEIPQIKLRPGLFTD